MGWYWAAGVGILRLGIQAVLKIAHQWRSGDRSWNLRWFHTRRTFVQILMLTPPLSYLYLNLCLPPSPSCCSRSPPSHVPSKRCPAKSFPPPAQTTQRSPPLRPDMSTSMRSVGPPSQKLIMLPSRASAVRLSSLLHTLLTLRHRWFHIKVCMVAGVGFFTDAYVIA